MATTMMLPATNVVFANIVVPLVLMLKNARLAILQPIGNSHLSNVFPKVVITNLALQQKMLCPVFPLVKLAPLKQLALPVLPTTILTVLPAFLALLSPIV